ncbi:hypothetical protein BD310DRAFT_534204 [Dichomitus squalens]|uniref:Uncharacterized protein n=1 Tax=Dichomitus squalens TaxID=114155 RepID=A0A4Q9PTI3_9APHY|nr:hypothetical protein BD310DRAFT_534204 [Dichomitus squalens]
MCPRTRCACTCGPQEGTRFPPSWRRRHNPPRHSNASAMQRRGHRSHRRAMAEGESRRPEGGGATHAARRAPSRVIYLSAPTSEAINIAQSQ